MRSEMKQYFDNYLKKSGLGFEPNKIKFVQLLFLLFLGLKLANCIGWSWWWVFAPMWGHAIIMIVALGCVGYKEFKHKYERN